MQPPQRPNEGNRDPGERPEAVTCHPGHRKGAPLDLGSLDLKFGEAAGAADLITALNFTESTEAALAAD